jgi:hypothetical protein
LANYEYKLGLSSESTSGYKKSIQLNKIDRSNIDRLFSLILSFDNTEEVEKYVQISSEVFTDKRDIITLNVYLLISKYLNGNIFWVKNFIENNKIFLNTERDEKYNNAIVFYKLIGLLTINIRKNIQLYSEENTVGRVIAIGESHALSAANAKIIIENNKFSIYTKFIMGIKMWHIASDNNVFADIFKRILNSIDKSQKVILMIGEIDCRDNEGIFIQRKILKLEDVIENTVSSYIEKILFYFKKYNYIHNLIIQGIPCPRRDRSIKLNSSDKIEYLKMIESVNLSLKNKCKDKNILFLDVYEKTKSPDMMSDGKFHLDPYHLNPIIYSELLIDKEGNYQ